MRKGWSQAHYHLDTFCTKVPNCCSVVTASFCPKVPLDLRHTALALGIKATSGPARGFLTRCKIGAGFSVQPVAGWAWGTRFSRTGSKCSDVGTNILCSFCWWNVLRHFLAAQRRYARMLVYQSSWQRLDDQVSPDLLKPKHRHCFLNRKIAQDCIARLHLASRGDHAAHPNLDRYHSSQNHTHGIQNHTCKMPMHARMIRPKGKLRQHRVREDEQQHRITACMIDHGLLSHFPKYHFVGGMHAVDRA